MPVDVVVPAHNEESTIVNVLGPITAAPSLGRLIVVCNGCTDQTENLAQQFTTDVYRTAVADKGSAMAAGLSLVQTDKVLFVDADLIGLHPGHVEGLMTAAPLDGMVVGLRDEPASGLGKVLPPISGERRLPTDFARSLRLPGSGYQAEVLIDAAVGRVGLPHSTFLMHGVTNPSHVTHKPLTWAKMVGSVTWASLVNAPELARFAAS